jgi:isopenicillin-N N-acyltransferase like protein
MNAHFPVIVAGGERFAAGLQYGKAARTRVRLSIMNYAATFAWCGLGWDETKTRARAFRQVIGDLDGELIDEMRGLAEGAGMGVDDILALNVRTEILPAEFGLPLRRAGRLKRAHALARNAGIGLDHPDVDAAPPLRSLDDHLSECTAIGVSKSKGAQGVTWLAQNWDWLGWQREALVVLKHANLCTLTEAGMLAKIGVNAHGFAVGLNILRSTEDGLGKLGAPVHIVLRLLLERCDGIPAAQKWLKSCQFSSSSNIMAADASGRVVAFELSPRGAMMVNDTDGMVVHTNHFLSESATEFEGNLGATLSSHPRFQCMSKFASEWQTQAHRPGLEDFKRALSDTSQGSASIARAPDVSMPAELRVESVASIIINCNEKTMHIAPQVPTPEGFTQVVTLP